MGENFFGPLYEMVKAAFLVSHWEISVCVAASMLASVPKCLLSPDMMLCQFFNRQVEPPLFIGSVCAQRGHISTLKKVMTNCVDLDQYVALRKKLVNLRFVKASIS